MKIPVYDYKPKHTGGKWGTDEADHDCPFQDIAIVAIDYRYDRIIARVPVDDCATDEDTYNLEQYANAKLIAAAPAMLQALRVIAGRQMAWDNLMSDRDIARQAIIYATGEFK